MSLWAIGAASAGTLCVALKAGSGSTAGGDSAMAVACGTGARIVRVATSEFVPDSIEGATAAITATVPTKMQTATITKYFRLLGIARGEATVLLLKNAI